MIPADDFALFDLPRRFDLDVEDLRRRYMEKARACHPDLAIGDADATRRATAESARLNRAYHTLADPQTRAEYLLSLAGESSPAAVSEEFLETILNLREQLAAGDAAAVRLRTEELQRTRLQKLTEAFAAERPDYPALATIVAQLRYLRRVLEQVE